MFLVRFFEKRLYTREADKVRAKTEASTLAGRNRHGGRERVEERKRGEGGRADREDLTEVGLLGVEDEDGDERNDEALD